MASLVASRPRASPVRSSATAPSVVRTHPEGRLMSTPIAKLPQIPSHLLPCLGELSLQALNLELERLHVHLRLIPAHLHIPGNVQVELVLPDLVERRPVGVLGFRLKRQESADHPVDIRWPKSVLLLVVLVVAAC